MVSICQLELFLQQQHRPGGDIWIAEAGQSDFSAALMRQNPAGYSGSRIYLMSMSFLKNLALSRTTRTEI
jgi:hypothetical protein